MALSQADLKAGIKGALDAAAKMTDNAELARESLASQISAAIHNYVSAADVNPGIPVATTGSSSAQTGKTIGKGRLS